MPSSGKSSATDEVVRRAHLGMQSHVSTPEHVENTGDNLRAAAEVQQRERDGETGSERSIDQPAVDVPLPDFNS